MSKSDVYQSIGSLAPDAVQMIIDRLEFRGNDPVFVEMREDYLDRMALETRKRVLDLGCGTGVATRAIAKRDVVSGEIVGIDLSEALIAAAQGFAADDGVAEQVTFRTGDCHALAEPDESFDAVITHTLISHVSDPAALIANAARVAAPGAPIAIFDGDYASMTFGAGEAAQNAGVVQGILDAFVANPFVMRQLPELLSQHGLEIVDFIPRVYAEAGTGSFFPNLAENYVPMAVKEGAIAPDTGPQWLEGQRAAQDKGRYFGACNYYTYLARKLA